MSTSTNIFEQAVRCQLRLELPMGSISVEQLYGARPSNTLKTALESYEQTLTEELEKMGKRTRSTKGKYSESRKLTELRLAIVTGYLDEKEAEQEAAVIEAQLKQHEQYLLSLIQDKTNEAYKSKSLDELQAEAAKLREQLNSLRN
jgi:uncharacterized membrane protein